jgi:hypothetical protein
MSGKELVVLSNQDLFNKFGLRAAIPEQFDHQVTGTFGECERMAYYSHILGRRLGREDKTALNWGKTMHSAKEAWETTQNPDAVIEAINRLLDDNIEDRYGRTKGRMWEAFLEYATFQKNNPIEIIRTEQPTAIRCESGVSCPYFEDGCGLEYGGRLDNIIRWQGIAGPLDLKTTVMDETDPISEYRPSHQFMGYVWVVSHLMANHSWGIIVDRMVTNKSKIKVNRYPVSFTRDNIREWVQNERVTQARLLYLFENHPYDETQWRQNYFRCFKPWPCSFRDACLASRDMNFRYRWLQQHTEERRWDFRNPDGEGAPIFALPQHEAFKQLLAEVQDGTA